MNKIMVFICLIAFVSCTNGDTCSVSLSDDAERAIQEYIDNHDSCKAILIRPKQETDEFGNIHVAGFFIGPCFSQFAKECDLPFYISYGERDIFFWSDISCIVKTTGVQNKDIQIDTLEEDDEYNPNEGVWVNYVRHAYYCQFEGTSLIVNTRPDTLFLPKFDKPEYMR